MANMSYCRFENTSSDLDDCVDNLEELLIGEDEDSESELAAAADLRELCEKFIEIYDSYKS